MASIFGVHTRDQLFFSIAELLAICIVARKNVTIFKQIQDELFFEGGFCNGDGPIVCVKLLANNDHRVRSHFERLINVNTAEDFKRTVQEESDARSLAEAEERRARHEAEEQARAERRKRAFEEKAAEERRRVEAKRALDEAKSKGDDAQAAAEAAAKESAESKSRPIAQKKGDATTRKSLSTIGSPAFQLPPSPLLFQPLSSSEIKPHRSRNTDIK